MKIGGAGGGMLGQGFGGHARDGRPSEKDFARVQEQLRDLAVRGLPLSDRVLEGLSRTLQTSADQVGGGQTYTEDRQP